MENGVPTITKTTVSALLLKKNENNNYNELSTRAGKMQKSAGSAIFFLLFTLTVQFSVLQLPHKLLSRFRIAINERFEGLFRYFHSS